MLYIPQVWQMYSVLCLPFSIMRNSCCALCCLFDMAFQISDFLGIRLSLPLDLLGHSFTEQLFLQYPCFLEICSIFLTPVASFLFSLFFNIFLFLHCSGLTGWWGLCVQSTILNYSLYYHLKNLWKIIVEKFIEHVLLRAIIVPNIKMTEDFFLKFVFGILLVSNVHGQDMPVCFIFFNWSTN